MSNRGQSMYIMSKMIMIILLIGLLGITSYTYSFFQSGTLRNFGQSLVDRITNVSQSISQSSSTSETQVFDLPFTIGSSTNRTSYELRLQTAEENNDLFTVVCLFTVAEATKLRNNQDGSATACSAFKVEGDVVFVDIEGDQPTEGILEIRPLDRKANLLIVRKVTACESGGCQSRICLMECSTQVGNGLNDCKSTLDKVQDDGGRFICNPSRT